MVTYADITRYKRQEDALQQAKQEAEAASEAKNQFLANVSHELRTPLSAILLWSAMFEEQQDLPPEDVKEGLETIRRSAEELQKLIEDLMDSVHITTGKLRLEPIEMALDDAVHQGMAAMRPAAQAKAIELHECIEGSLGIVRADPFRRQQIIWNLFSNALKFTPRGGRIGRPSRSPPTPGKRIVAKPSPAASTSVSQAHQTLPAHHGTAGPAPAASPIRRVMRAMDCFIRG